MVASFGSYQLGSIFIAGTVSSQATTVYSGTIGDRFSNEKADRLTSHPAKPAAC
jgi:hypothetical protein